MASPPSLIRLVLIGAPGSEFRLAAEMARQAGASVSMADDPGAALETLRRTGGDLVMIDVEMDVPGFLEQLRAERMAVPVLACGIHASAERAVAAIRAGAIDYIPLPPQLELIAAALIAAGQRVSSLLGGDPALGRAIDYARAVAPSAVPILIAGESGTGKEVMARMVHDTSRRVGRFLVIECAGATPDIVESELFGHEAGTFSGAVAARAGRLEEAAQGTIFLREIGALTPPTQARLATALQTGVIRTANDGTKVSLRARVIASSSCDLSVQAASGAFRADLLAHLRIVRIDMPPLRSRGADVEKLSAHFAEELAVANGLPVRPFSDDALRHLCRHDWPGNIRELEDVVHRAILLARGPTIEADALVLSDGSQLAPVSAAPPSAGCELQVDSLVGRSVADVERELILQTLKSCGGNRTTASTILGISVRTMRNKLKSFVESGIAVSPAF